MKHTTSLILATIALASCLDLNQRPSLSMIADVNDMNLSVADTLVVTRTLTNTGRNTMWLNASGDAYEMTNQDGARACTGTTSLDLTVPQVVRIPVDSTAVVERRFPLSELQNCAPGNHAISFVAHFREREDAGDTFTLRTSLAAFTITEPPAP